MNPHETAREYLDYNLSIIPVKPDKSPFFPWAKYQKAPLTPEELESLFEQINEPFNLGIICGKCSQDLEGIDFDNKDAKAEQRWEEYRNLPEVSEIIGRYNLPYESTPSGGYHLYYRCATIERNQKLAMIGGATAIETRGEGGYLVATPSDGYSLLSGSFHRIAEIAPEERAILLSACKGLSDIPQSKEVPPEGLGTQLGQNRRNTSTNFRPGDLFNEDTEAAGIIRDLLRQSGWTFVRKIKNNDQYRRPGKNEGISATFNGTHFYNFSTNAQPFEAGKSYALFSTYAKLKHGGNYTAAAKELISTRYSHLKVITPFDGAFTTKLAESDKSTVDTIRAFIKGQCPVTDQGKANLFAAAFKDCLRYAHGIGKWYIWNGRFWECDETEKVYSYIRCLSRWLEYIAYEEEDPVNKGKIHKLISSLQNDRVQRITVSMAKKLSPIRTLYADFDARSYLFNLNNHTIELLDDQYYFREFRQEDLLTQTSPVDFVTEAKCPNWIAFLEKIFNCDQSLIDYLQKALGATLHGGKYIDKLFFMYGTGANGKSVFIETLAYIFGDYSKKLNFTSITELRNDNAPRNDIARLKGARFVSISEVEDGKRLNESLIKDLTGGDTITARYLHQEYFDFKPQAKFWMYGNHKPIIKGNDHGIKRRVKMIPFAYRFTKEEEETIPKEKALKSLMDEAAGIILWILQGYNKFVSEGFVEPEKVREATGEYFSSMDLITGFLEECCKVYNTVGGNNFMEKSKVLHQAFEKYCNDIGEKTVITKRKFTDSLKDRGFEITPGSGNERLICGISLKAEEDENVPF